MRTECDTPEDVARQLAFENGSSEDEVRRIYWFPDPTQIRLVEVDDGAFTAEDDEIHAIYFGVTPDLPFPAGIALVPPAYERRKSLPPEWRTDWDKAVLVFERETAAA